VGQRAEGRTALSLLYCLKFEGDYNPSEKIFYEGLGDKKSITVMLRDECEGSDRERNP
jgi:hypothetical protein